MDYSLDSVQSVLLDVSNFLYEFCQETRCSDIQQIKKEAF